MSPPLELTAPFHSADRRARHPFAFVAERLWLDFVNTDTGARGTDALHDFGRFVRLARGGTGASTRERARAMQRRALQQPAGALAVLGDARRVRAVLRTLAERGAASQPGTSRRAQRRSTASSAAAPARAVSSCATTAPSRAPSSPSATPSPACSSRSSRALPTRSSSASWNACAAAPTRAADACSRTRRRMAAGGGATWRRAAIERRPRRHRMKLHVVAACRADCARELRAAPACSASAPTPAPAA